MRALVSLPVLATLLASSPVAAEGPPKPSSNSLRDAAPVAIGVNSPFSWLKERDKGFGASLYIGVSRHLAIRANYATYAEDGPTLRIIGELMGGESAGYSGSITDLGAGLVYYPRRLWSGPMLELGALRRATDTSYTPEFADQVKTNTATYGARGMVGWSWTFAECMYVGIAIGLSVGREAGTEIRTPDFGDRMPVRADVARTTVDTEGYLRIGFAFGR
jgi:hypothetical protein